MQNTEDASEFQKTATTATLSAFSHAGTLATWSGGAGEAEVISWAMAHAGFVALLDDRAARRLAAQQGVSVLGSLRVIVKAKERGLISELKRSARPEQFGVLHDRVGRVSAQGSRG